MDIRKCNEKTVITTGVSGRFPNGQYRHGLCIVSEGDEGRRVFEGPMVPGPWAAAFGLCASITNTPGTGSGADAERGRASGNEFPVVTGDLLEIEGNIYEVETFRQDEYVNLHLMELSRSESDRRSRLSAYQIAAEDKRAAEAK